MSYRQLRRPNTGAVDFAGWCLRHTQKVFGAPEMYETAWLAWQGQRGRHNRGMPTNVSVAVWFSHWGTYNGVRKNWGHVVAWIPGRGYLSSPGFGHGQAWFPNIQAVERYFGAKYVGWTSWLHTIQLVEQVKAQTKPKPGGSSADNKEDFSIMAADFFARRNSQTGIHAINMSAGKNRGRPGSREVGSLEWNAYKSAMRNAKQSLPLTNCSEKTMKALIGKAK